MLLCEGLWIGFFNDHNAYRVGAVNQRHTHPGADT